MENEALRRLKDELGVINYKINYKTGVHLGVIEDFFDRKRDDIDPKDRAIIAAMLLKEKK